MAGETIQQQPDSTEQQGQQQPHHSVRQPREAGQFAGAPRPQDQHDAKQQAQQMFKVRYKADGKDVEEELDEATLSQRLSMAKGFYKKAEESAALRKQLEQASTQRAAAFGDPKAFRTMVTEEMERTGVDRATATVKVKDLLTDVLHDFLREEAEDPKDRELRELREKEQQRAREASEKEQQQRLEESKARIREKGQKMYDTLSAALKAAQKGGLPVDENTLRVMGTRYLQNLRHKVDLTEGELVSYYAEELDRDVGARTKAITFEQARQRFPELVRTIAKGLREEARKPRGAASAPQAQRPAMSQGGPQLTTENRQRQAPPTYDSSDHRSFSKLSRG